jgi:hypothetical protein
MTVDTSRALISDTKAALSERKNDLYESPPEAVRALLKAESLPPVIWEPACGPGSIVRVLRASGHRVVASDLVDYESPDQDHAGWDFLSERALPPLVQAIVTNPPFKNASEFVAHALDLCPRVIMLLRLAFLESARRTLILDGGSLARVHVFKNRLPMMHRDGWDGPKVSNPTAFAWFVWDCDHKGPTELHRISWEPTSVSDGEFNSSLPSGQSEPSVTLACTPPDSSSGDGLGIHQPGSMTWGGSEATPAPSGRARDRVKGPAVTGSNLESRSESNQRQAASTDEASAPGVVSRIADGRTSAAAVVPATATDPEQVPFGLDAGATAPGREPIDIPMGRNETGAAQPDNGAGLDSEHDARSVLAPSSMGPASIPFDDEIPECLRRKPKAAA